MKCFLLLCLAALAFCSGAAAQTNAVPPLTQLERNIQRVTQSVNADWGIYIKCLETGEEVAMNADRQMDTMSVIKLPLLAEAFRQIDARKFALTDKVTITADMKRPGTGVIRSLDAGDVLTVKDLLTLMVIVSDNTATDVIFDKVGGTEPVNRLMKDWGFECDPRDRHRESLVRCLAVGAIGRSLPQAGKDAVRLEFPTRHGEAAGKVGKRRRRE
jgi:beta-lactamase class A